MAGEPHGAVSTVEPARARWRRWRDVARTTYRIVRSNPTGRLALRVGVALVGGAVLVLGIILIPLPGPGWALVLLGLSIWAIEFVWARHLLRFTRRQLTRWLRWIGLQPLPIRMLVGAMGMATIGIVAMLSLKYSFGIDLWADFWRYITSH